MGVTGTILAYAAVGAAVGYGVSAIEGGNTGKGAMLGALGGALGGAYGVYSGAAGSTAGGVAGGGGDVLTADAATSDLSSITTPTADGGYTYTGAQGVETGSAAGAGPGATMGASGATTGATAGWTPGTYTGSYPGDVMQGAGGAFSNMLPGSGSGTSGATTGAGSGGSSSIVNARNILGMMSVGTGVSNAMTMRELAKNQMQQTDAAAAQRMGYQAQLSALMNNPNSVTNTPGYQFGLDTGLQGVERTEAAAGQGPASGATLLNLQQYGTLYGQNYLQQQEKNLMDLANGGFGATPVGGGSVLPSLQASNNAMMGQFAAGALAGNQAGFF
jgi:hypothetical protein